MTKGEQIKEMKAVLREAKKTLHDYAYTSMDDSLDADRVIESIRKVLTFK